MPQRSWHRGYQARQEDQAEASQASRNPNDPNVHNQPADRREGAGTASTICTRTSLRAEHLRQPEHRLPAARNLEARGKKLK
jgi:hypothetical protein